MELTKIIGTTSAISPRKGKLAYDYVKNELKKGTKVIISFEGITDFSSSFCNSFIGKLYMSVDSTNLENLLHFIDLESDSIWFKKINAAKRLGTDENLRANRKANLNDLTMA